ncbi:MAG TPA: ABC transporter permease subunit, partial [Polyangiaceae bacterium]|nr:ABC transporter permease subunit [Polyangiaceae bacterium]
MSEALTLVVGLGLLAATAWCPPRASRVLGCLLFGLVVGVVLRFSLGGVGGVIGGGLAAGLAYRFLPLLVLRRVVFLVPALVLLIYATTLLMYRAPGNPFANERATSPQVEAALRAQYGVPKNANQFFGIYMRRLLVDGTLGPSIKVQGRTVEELIAPAFPVSLALGLLALTLSVIFGLSLGVLAGLKRNSMADYSSMALALVGISLPSFVIGASLMIVFALWLRWLPVAGWGSYRHLVMPAFALSLPSAAVIARLSRSGMIEIMQQDFVRTARAKGLPESWVIGRHALRGAVIPVVSYLGPAAAAIMTGSFVVEVLFAIPGMGQWFVKGAINRDYSVVLGTAIVYFGLVILFNLLVDLAYAWLDPRIREDRA